MAHWAKRSYSAPSGNILRNGFREFHSYKNIQTFLGFLPMETLKALIKKYQADKPALGGQVGAYAFHLSYGSKFGQFDQAPHSNASFKT